MHLPDKSADSDDSYIEFVLKELRKYTSCIKDTSDANKITLKITSIILSSIILNYSKLCE